MALFPRCTNCTIKYKMVNNAPCRDNIAPKSPKANACQWTNFAASPGTIIIGQSCRGGGRHCRWSTPLQASAIEPRMKKRSVLKGLTPHSRAALRTWLYGSRPSNGTFDDHRISWCMRYLIIQLYPLRRKFTGHQLALLRVGLFADHH